MKRLLDVMVAVLLLVAFAVLLLLATLCVLMFQAWLYKSEKLPKPWKCLLIAGLAESTLRLFLKRRIASSGTWSRLLAEEKYDVRKVNSVMLKEMGIQ